MTKQRIVATALLLVASTVVALAQPNTSAAQTTDQVAPNQQYGTEAGMSAAGNDCFGYTEAWKSGSTLLNYSYLDCSASTYESVLPVLYHCHGGGTSYCGSPEDIGDMGPECTATVGPLWCPASGTYKRYNLSSGVCYMVIAWIYQEDSSGGHSGSASSAVQCF